MLAFFIKIKALLFLNRFKINPQFSPNNKIRNDIFNNDSGDVMILLQLE
tara:strand:+ start:279 stop:425 length:147 start_codon:yes stop_codon:yes gene_type:complete